MIGFAKRHSTAGLSWSVEHHHESRKQRDRPMALAQHQFTQCVQVAAGFLTLTTSVIASVGINSSPTILCRVMGHHSARPSELLVQKWQRSLGAFLGALLFA